MNDVNLIGDIGGTNARFALAVEEGARFHSEVTVKCDEFRTPELAIRQYLDQCGVAVPRSISLAVAGPIKNNAVKLTNNPWQLETGSLSTTFATPLVRLLNDFEAVAYAMPRLTPDDLIQVGAVEARDLSGDYNLCVIGAGTGLGAAGLVRRGGIEIALVTEAGHMGFAPEGTLQCEILETLLTKYSRVSDERLVSGMGVENLYWALGRLKTREVPDATAAEIFELAEAGEEIAVAAIELFFLLMGQVAGDLVLAMGAFDGAFIAGGIAQRHQSALLNSRFIEGFTNKGRHRHLLERVPALLVTHPQPGLLGAASVATRLVL